jgi:uncharacterized protein (DUF488 family)
VEIFTIGHSTHELDAFVALLDEHGIGAVTDVRTVPRSRRVPHFNAESLEVALGSAGFDYAHIPGIGGLRKPAPDSVNMGWQHEGFRGFADHMATPEFERTLGELVDRASTRRTAVMCAEGLWWRCHRRLISDALTVRGVRVGHVLPDGKLEDHRVTEFAVADGTRLTYPAAQASLDL